MNQPVNGVQVDIPAGAVIFQQGDHGGDLYFLKEGEVEVYRSMPGRDVRLAVLGPGEVLGIMTCLTREPRLASARALTPIKALVVKQAGIKTLISSTPTWVHTVIKDFTVRVKAMDELYADALRRIELLENETSQLRFAIRVAKGLAEVGALIAVPSGDQRVVDVDAALAHLARVLDVPTAKTMAAFESFVSCGLLKIEAQATDRRADLNVLMRLGGFADLGRAFLGTVETRARIESMFGKDCAFLQTMCDAVKAQKLKLSQECEWPTTRLAAEGYPIEYVLGCLQRAEAAGFVKLKRTGDQSTVTFVPTTLLSGLHAVVAIAYFRALGGANGEASGPAAAVVV